ncbi:YrbI family 3-deoxy-D-manno-octulosonate 8-phosphate phosphatase [Isoptericola sp. CG 20/1183]|uniref:N-acylneuraminate cytidylyltransferase n=2 Tax=Promicromonosporaceae TaxID=85017 RepID=A0ABX5EFU1_9MICO|nr:YrbI family 3-deoxy-D-manno-octulosonate 8-phosphate phosphatase [Isoptericola halotolerans]PRZ06646.1 YrbI family 3-deoxy-D-manno-octulosonate 8-phosphate phosphatase [Isoptericola sp. CG 20/1183]
MNESVLVVVPARGGSAGVPLKNLQRVGGSSLVARAVRSAAAAPAVTDVVVSTDHAEIAREAARHGARVVERPADLSGATASSESAVLHVLDGLAADGAPQPAVTVLLQATSPFVDPADLDGAVRQVLDGTHDVVVAVAATHDFQWRMDPDGPVPVGHTTDHRPRRQDRAPHYRETGAFYVMRTAGLREHGTRFFGSVGLQPVAPEWAVEIDEPRDLWLSRTLLDQPTDAERRGSDRIDRAKRSEPRRSAPEGMDVDALVTDFDGVHTDDGVYVSQDGVEQVRVHRGDGLGVGHLRSAGVPLLILSKETNPVVTARARKLGVDVLQGIDDKATALRDWCAANRLDPDRVAYVGNDVNDLPALRVVGWPVAVADAHPDVLAAARVVTEARGGHGAVREICDRITIHRKDPVMTATSTAPARPVHIGEHAVATGEPVYVIGEIGINHNGDVEIAKQLIDVAVAAGCQAVKFQKRTPEISTPKDQRDKIRQTPWGEMTYLEYKYKVEFEHEQYSEIDQYAKAQGVQWFASPWDVPSVAFLEEFGVPTHKIASASVTDHELLRALADTDKPLILSTGMSTLEQIDAAVEILGTDDLVILHSTSTYPLPPEEANLRTITTLQERYGVPVGYSGHETGLQISLAAVALGAVAVERHITLDRAMWGSDHAASLEPKGLSNLVRDIRILQEALGDGEKKVMPGELAPMSRLRRTGA